MLSSTDRKDLCLICNETITILKVYNTARHHNSKHKEAQKLLCALRRGKVTTLRRVLESQHNFFRKETSNISSALRANYRFAHVLTK
jgi:hypothetical protein